MDASIHDSEKLRINPNPIETKTRENKEMKLIKLSLPTGKSIELGCLGGRFFQNGKKDIHYVLQDARLNLVQGLRGACGTDAMFVVCAKDHWGKGISEHSLGHSR